MQYVLSHAENVSACADDGEVHAGNGECVDPIPSCPKPETPSNEGTMTLSSEFIIPGVTAKYAQPLTHTHTHTRTRARTHTVEASLCKREGCIGKF